MDINSNDSGFSGYIIVFIVVFIMSFIVFYAQGLERTKNPSLVGITIASVVIAGIVTAIFNKKSSN